MNIENIILKSQKQLKRALALELQGLGYHTKSEKGFLYAEGEIPVLLVAHLDTVHKTQVQTICYSADGNILMSPEGIGGDDRAGVYMVLEIIKKQKCHVLFCEDEEIGGVGATLFTNSGILPDVNYIVEFDRRGKNDAVFYDCDNPEFTEFICKHGFEKNNGSFSDISVLAPYLGVAAVNISAGYYNEHTRHETINLEHAQRNIEIVEKMIQKQTGKFDYIEAYNFNHWFDDYDSIEKTLMLLPDSAYVVAPGGKMFEATECHMIDSSGKLYEYFPDLEVAIRLESHTAYSENNLPVKFQRKKANNIEVVPISYIYDVWDLDADSYEDEIFCMAT